MERQYLKNCNNVNSLIWKLHFWGKLNPQNCQKILNLMFTLNFIELYDKCCHILQFDPYKITLLQMLFFERYIRFSCYTLLNETIELVPSNLKHRWEFVYFVAKIEFYIIEILSCLKYFKCLSKIKVASLPFWRIFSFSWKILVLNKVLISFTSNTLLIRKKLSDPWWF